MAITGNKGEWSEIYTLFKLLGDGKVHAGDADLNKLELYYPIINIIRHEVEKFEYKPDTDQKIIIIDEEGKEFARIPMGRFVEESKSLLNNIKSADTSTFEVPASETFMHEIGCTKLKAPSGDKADIHIVIHDLRTNMTPMLGFSIKSQLGSPSTLLNPGNTTNFLYKLSGSNLSDDQIEAINAINVQAKRMQAIEDAGCTLVFDDVENEVFRNNLMFLDSSMSKFIARCLLSYYSPKPLHSVQEIVKDVAEENMFDFTGNDVLAFYQHKMKVLLLDVALGMTPAKEWTGRYDANGGYLVVRDDGEIVCYHFYNRNDVEDYLFNNTKFDMASRSRYNFGKLFRGDDGEIYIRLNLQIRFNK